MVSLKPWRISESGPRGGTRGLVAPAAAFDLGLRSLRPAKRRWVAAALQPTALSWQRQLRHHVSQGAAVAGRP